MRALLLVLPLFALGACAGILEEIGGLTGLSQEQIACIGRQLAALPSGTEPLEAAQTISMACNVSIDEIIFGSNSATAVAEGVMVTVPE